MLKVILHINNMSSQNPLPRSSRSVEKILGVEIGIQSLPIATLRLALTERAANFMCVTIYGTGKILAEIILGAIVAADESAAN